MGIARITRDSALLSVAHTFSMRSSCERLQVGAVFSLDGRILVTGYNGTPSGMEHCDHLCTCAFPLGEWQMNPASRENPSNHKEECPRITPCILAVHAEANAISYAARKGVSLEGSELHVTTSPCLACAMLIINAGVVRVVFQHDYRNSAGTELLVKAGIQVFS